MQNHYEVGGEPYHRGPYRHAVPQQQQAQQQQQQQPHHPYFAPPPKAFAGPSNGGIDMTSYGISYDPSTPSAFPPFHNAATQGLQHFPRYQQVQPHQMHSSPRQPDTSHMGSSSNSISSNVPATTSSPASSSDAGQRHVGVTPLRRGQACQSCRRRKLKCDALRPICSQCAKSRKAAALANHVSPVPEGDCVYDDLPPSSGQGHAHSNGSPHSPHIVEDKPSLKRHRPSGSFGNGNNMASTNGFEASTPLRASFDVRRKPSVGHHIEPSPPMHETTEQRALRLENRVAELEEKLRQARSAAASGSVGTFEASMTPHKHRSRATSRDANDSDESQRPVVPIISMLSPLSGREERHRLRYFQRPARYGGVPAQVGHNVAPHGGASYDSSSSAISMSKDSNMDVLKSNSSDTGSNVTTVGQNDVDVKGVLDVVGNAGVQAESSSADEVLMQLLWPGWSSDLPSADTVTSLCDIFFRLHPLRSLVYRPSFMSGLMLPQKHPHRPHDSLIHAIMAAAADLSPFYESSSSAMPGLRDRLALMLPDPFSRPNSQQPQSANMLTFKEFHLSKARLKVERSLMTDFRNPLDWISSCLISVFVLWNDSRFVESYFLSSFVARALAPAGLDKLPSRHFPSGGKVLQAPGIFGEPSGIEEHERRMALWHAFIADQYTSGPPSFYENMISEAALLTHLPSRVSDFFAGTDVPPNKQSLSSSDLFTAGHLDDFTLHIKSCVLLRRTCTLLSRSQFSRDKPAGVPLIDRHIDEFISTFPVMPLHEASTDGLNAYANISLALIYLHEPHLNRTALCTVPEAEPAPSSSNARVLMAVERILNVLHQLVNSSLDFALLHPQMFLTWGVCARMLGKDMMLLQKKLQSDRTEAEKRAQGKKESGAQSSPSSSIKKKKALASDEPAALARVFDNLSLIIDALRRGGVKSIKARRCAELVSSVRSGHLHESFLSQLLYLDGVMPVEVEDSMTSGMPDFAASLMAMPSSFPLDALAMNAPAGGEEANPTVGMESILSDPMKLDTTNVGDTFSGQEKELQDLSDALTTNASADRGDTLLDLSN